jgi:ribonuclease HI
MIGLTRTDGRGRRQCFKTWPPDSQAAIKALGKYQITSKLVWNCQQSLIQLAEYNRVQLIWVPGREGIVGSETADQLARTGSEHPFTGPEPAWRHLSWSCQESGQGLDE